MTTTDAARRAEQMFLRLMGPDATPDDWDEHERLAEDLPEYRRCFEACRETWDTLGDIDPASLRVTSADAALTRPAWAWAAAATIVLALAAGFLALRGDDLAAPLQFATDVNEHRTVELDDGSRLVIGASSSVRVNFSGDQRLVELSGGQLLANVATDPRRPFIVATNDVQAIATGTAFDVRDGKAYSTISVVEGSVLVLAHPGESQAQLQANGTELLAGQQLRAARGMPAGNIEQVDIGQVTAWQQRQLYFHEDELRTVFEQVMRYNDIDIRVLDPVIEERLYSGSFRPDRLDSWLDAMERAYDLRVTRHGKSWVAIAPADERRPAQ